MKWTATVDPLIPENAAYSRVLAVAHVEEEPVFQEGERISAAMREFVKEGKTALFKEKLDKAKSDGKVSDWTLKGKEKNGPTDTVDLELTLDGEKNATWVTLFARLEPSPGWFVGSVAFPLCDEKKRVFLASNADHGKLLGYNSGLSTGDAYTDPYSEHPLGEQQSVSIIKSSKVAQYGNLDISPEGKIRAAPSTSSSTDGGGFRVGSWYSILGLCLIALIAVGVALFALQKMRKKSSSPLGAMEQGAAGEGEADIDW